ncbi:nitroreductase [Micromonospora sp. WMMD1102]|uniref:nitroreductase n=1 Tax=Micromonospora sp. WMMD1102 TaxID=3016105 RepID=UPI0024155AD4|nr:nitroreductase [Micromonospora sp. WMMD1102]MDG4787255.1 nitroreductase [Micromonospora sp. WMMD1102]
MSSTGYTRADLDRAVAAAARAPGAEQSRRWLRLRDGAIDVLATPSGVDGSADRAGWAARVGGGAGLFNVRLALAVCGRPALVRLRPNRDEPELLARLHPGPVQSAGPAERELCAALPYCAVAAGPVLPASVPPEVRRRLIEAARIEHGWLELIVGHPAVAAFAQIEASARRVLERVPAEAAGAIRWRTAPPPDSPGAVASLPGGPGAVASLVDGPDAVPPPLDAGGEPMVAVLGSPLDTPGDQLRAGQAVQRLLLTVTAAGLKAGLHAQVVAVPAAREQLRLALGRSGRPQMVLRIGQVTAGRLRSAGTAAPHRTAREDGSKVPGTGGPPALPRVVVGGVEWR